MSVVVVVAAVPVTFLALAERTSGVYIMMPAFGLICFIPFSFLSSAFLIAQTV